MENAALVVWACRDSYNDSRAILKNKAKSNSYVARN